MSKPMFPQRDYPALHAILHRFGMPKGVRVDQQNQARDDLRCLLAKIEGQRDEAQAEVERLVAGMKPGAAMRLGYPTEAIRKYQTRIHELVTEVERLRATIVYSEADDLEQLQIKADRGHHRETLQDLHKWLLKMGYADQVAKLRDREPQLFKAKPVT